jgi:NodT family efflux transporter outer membrane factor (OMF) lipoprotein
LGILLGLPPSAIMGEFVEVRAIPGGPPEVPAGLPSELLRRRADIRRAEQELRAATARVGVAVADLYPKFALTGAFGFQSEKPRNLFDWSSRFWDIAPQFTWPIFDAGRIRANIDVQDARQEQAVILYQQSILNALRDVEDALIAYSKEQARRAELVQAVENSRRSVELANTLYQGGARDFLNVIDAQRSLLLAEDALVQSERATATNLVALYKALGGGWE